MKLSSRIEKYLYQQLASSYAITAGVVVIAIAFVDVVEQMRGVGKRVHLSIIEAFGLTALKIPNLIDETLAFIVLIGTMMTLIRMNRRGEFSALRAAGISAWRFTRPAFVTAAALGIVATIILNPAGIYLNAQYELRKAQLKGEGVFAQTNKERVWLRQPDKNGQTIITGMPSRNRSPELSNPTFYFFAKTDNRPIQFTRRIDAQTAMLEGKKWTLFNAVENIPGGSQNLYTRLTLPTDVSADTLLGRFAKPDAVSFWNLPSLIAGLKNAGFTPQRYEYQFQKMLARPVLFAAMAALAAAFCLGLARDGGLVTNGAIAVALGILLYFFLNLAGAFALAEAAPPSLAAWSPPIAALAGALAVLSRREDG
jgi:lipopolysaccharide export system permease protein